jgi:hypothetical protein
MQPRFSQRQIIWVGAGISAAVVILLIIVNQVSNTREARANTVNDYRTVGSGNWATTGTWQRFDGTNWVAAASAPNAGANVITIRNGHTVTVAANTDADQLIIDAGGRLNINNGRTLTINAGAGTDMDNSGTVGNSGTITLNGGATIVHQSGGAYIHSRDGGTIPTATWNAASNCNITGVTGNMPAQINQNFGNLTWNCTSQSSSMAFNTNMAIQGNFTMQASNGRYLGLTTNSTSRTFTVGGSWIHTNGDFRGSNSSGGGTITVNGNFSISGSTSTSWYTGTSGSGVCNTIINGNLNISGGIFWVNEDANPATLTVGGNYTHTDGEFVGNDGTGGSTTTISGDFSLSGPTSTCFCTITSGAGLSTMNVNGNASVTGGNLLLTESTNNGIFNLKGNYTHTGGFVWENATANTGEIVFNGTAQQLCDANTAAVNNVNFTVKNSSWLQFATAGSFLQSAGNFTLEAAGRIGIRSTDGITTSGTAGHIRVSGTRSFNAGADYDYNGSALQNSGNGLPSTVRNLSFDNSAGITLTGSVNPTGTLTLQNGIISTGANQLTLGSSAASIGTLSRTNGHVNGTFRRWVASSVASNILFPVGTSGAYNGFNMSFTAAPSGGLISSIFLASFPGNFGLPINDAGEECSSIGSGWWVMSGSNGFSGGTFDVNATAEGFGGIVDYSLLHLFRRDHSGALWTNSGTHVVPTGNASSPVVNRSGLTQLGDFGITSNAVNPLPVTLTYFRAKPNGSTVLVSWATSTEKNSDYFMVQRSADGKSYDDFRRSDAAGNSTTTKSYRVTDSNPLPGISYYRLRQFDRDGKMEVFGPVAVNFTRNSKTADQSFMELTAGPNPFRSELTLRFVSTIDGEQPITVYNIQGAVVFRGVFSISTGSNTIPLPAAAQFSSGRYLLELGEGNSVQRLQVVKL